MIIAFFILVSRRMALVKRFLNNVYYLLKLRCSGTNTFNELTVGVFGLITILSIKH